MVSDTRGRVAKKHAKSVSRGASVPDDIATNDAGAPAVEIDRAVPRHSPKKLKAASGAAARAPYVDVSPYTEFPGKARWTTPLRAGAWVERWESARELGTVNAVRSAEQENVSVTIRAAVAEVVVASVGDILPKATVEKWLCLLCEYLELNADEQVLVVCLLRRFVEYGGKFVGQGDWARPQRWECVVAIACYFAVLLTEEFPGRTSMDLRELLGPNFRFGQEQLAFLDVIKWRITIDAATFKEVKVCCVNVTEKAEGARKTLMSWFKLDNVLKERKVRVENAAKEAADAAKAAKAAMSAYAAAQVKPQDVSSKKRSYASIAPIAPNATDSLVPHHFPQHYIVPQHFVQSVPANMIPSVPQWLPRGW